MNVLEEDAKEAQLLEMNIAHCLYEVICNNEQARETGMRHYFNEAKEWAFLLREKQVELDELFLRKEESDKQHVRVFGGVMR